MFCGVCGQDGAQTLPELQGWDWAAAALGKWNIAGMVPARRDPCPDRDWDYSNLGLLSSGTGLLPVCPQHFQNCHFLSNSGGVCSISWSWERLAALLCSALCDAAGFSLGILVCTHLMTEKAKNKLNYPGTHWKSDRALCEPRFMHQIFHEKKPTVFCIC